MLVWIISLLSSCGQEKKYYTFKTELGDTLCLEISMSGNLHGMYPGYKIYDDDENINKTDGFVIYVDRTSRDRFPYDPLSNITTVGTYGGHNFYKVFDTLFYYKKGVYMDSISENFDVDDYESYKKDSQVPDFIIYRVQAISDLMKSQNFEYIYRYGEILAFDKDPSMYDMLVRYAHEDFTDSEKQINTSSNITEAYMTIFAQNMLEKYYKEYP